MLPVFLPAGTRQCSINPDFFADLLTNPGISAPADAASLRDVRPLLDKRADAELARRCTDLRYPNDNVLVAVADITAT